MEADNKAVKQQATSCGVPRSGNHPFQELTSLTLSDESRDLRPTFPAAGKIARPEKIRTIVVAVETIANIQACATIVI
jgi:hypothetical protein